MTPLRRRMLDALVLQAHAGRLHVWRPVARAIEQLPLRVQLLRGKQRTRRVHGTRSPFACCAA